MMNTRCSLISCALLLVTAGCATRIEGILEVDGQKAEIQKCASAEHHRIDNAIDLTTSQGSFRIAQGENQQAEISYLVSAGGTIGGIPVAGQTTVIIAGCGPMTLTRADYKRNEVYPLSGIVTLDCNNLETEDAERHSFHGTLTFENCR